MRPTGATTTNWSEELEGLHQESSRTHFIDVWTRRAIISRLRDLPADPAMVDVGCSTGYLLEDLRDRFPAARLAGFDLVMSGLQAARSTDAASPVGQADACFLPLPDASVDAVVSANLLEHVRDDVRALAEMARVLKPGGRAVIVVPAAPGTYDYYDRYLRHERRYGRGELATKAQTAGFVVEEDRYLGWTMFPAFWVTKKRNRVRFDQLSGEELRLKVARDIDTTKDSQLGHLACRLEERLFDRGVAPPFGIRGLTVLRRPSRSANSSGS